LRRMLKRLVVAILCASAFVGAQVNQAEGPGPVTLQTSEPLFAVLTAINVCGYDAELANSVPLRAQIRDEANAALQASPDAIVAKDVLCKIFHERQQPDSARELSQYVSLGVNLAGPPFQLTMKQADLPPDALGLVDSQFVPALQTLYDTAKWHELWQKHDAAYNAHLEKLHPLVTEMIFQTDIYLKLPMSSYLGRKFAVFVEPQAAPSQVNARNYRDDYFIVLSPGQNTALRLDQVRHTYLHYILDPLALKRANVIKRLGPLLETVQKAPLEEIYKNDASLMLVESLVRAIEARTLTANTKDPKVLDTVRSSAAQTAMEQGFVLTRYFYDALAAFEKGPTGFRDAFGDLLIGIDIGKERRRAENVRFTAQATPELMRASNSRRLQLLDVAEQKLLEGDTQGAHQIAQRVLDERSEDPARAMFILGKAATRNKDIDGAQLMFERSLELAKEPRTKAWAHIYLARILDLRCSRDAALSHYRAALSAGDPRPDTKTAADKGIASRPERCTGPEDKN
jgi:tetratricopeptide (TPR) repeat protein